MVRFIKLKISEKDIEASSMFINLKMYGKEDNNLSKNQKSN